MKELDLALSIDSKLRVNVLIAEQRPVGRLDGVSARSHCCHGRLVHAEPGVKGVQQGKGESLCVDDCGYDEHLFDALFLELFRHWDFLNAALPIAPKAIPGGSNKQSVVR